MAIDVVERFVHRGGHRLLSRSETRAALRRFFEVDAERITLAALVQLARRGLIEPSLVEQAIDRLGVDLEKVSPMRA